MELEAVAAWVGLEPAPDRVDRLARAVPIVTEAARVVRSVTVPAGGVPRPAPGGVPLRAPGGVPLPAPPGGEATEPCELTMLEAVVAIRRGELSPAELLDSCLATIERTEPAIGAFARLTPDTPRRHATGILHGIPFAAKDVIDTANVATEFGSAVFAGRVPRANATVVSRIEAAGGILIGKTATHEIAYGVSTPQVRNPWNPEKMTSGSSGGSAAALAARQIPVALGTDTGGSLRLPSAFCGTTAIKPTHGLVPRDGVMPLASSFDVVGPMARTAADCWLLLQVLTGADPVPPTTVDLPNLRIGITDLTRPQQSAVAETMRDLGARLIDVELPSLETTQATATVLAFAEASAEFRPHVVGGARFADDIQSLLEAGLTIPVADFLHAGRVRARIRREYDELFGRVDLILLPTSPVTDLPHGIVERDGVPLIPLLTPFTLPASLTGLPAIAFPCGFTETGMPVGVQLMGPDRSESLLAGVVAAYQEATDWHTRKPALSIREST
jgi:aspartyl-tRNA(Asn)/glutamyl-tRNA(Gln) amidotransferase subunit A